MPKTIAALIRHGDYHQRTGTPSAWQPYALNTAGKEHARQAAIDLNNIIRDQQWHLDPVCDASRLLRAWQTASIIGHELTGFLPELTGVLKLENFDALAERGVGSVANLTIAEIEDIIEQDPRYGELPENWKSSSYYRLPFQGAESLMEAGERVAAHLLSRMQKLRAQVAVDTVKLFVGHGAAFRHAAYQLGVLDFHQIEKLSMYHGQPVFIEMTAEGNWRHVAGEWKVRAEKTEYTD